MTEYSTDTESSMKFLTPDKKRLSVLQVSQAMLDATTPCASVIRATCDTIRREFGIDWTTVTWSDLRKPLYSGLAAVLYLMQRMGSNSTSIPSSIEGQESFWTHYYHFGAPVRNFTSAALSTTFGKVNDHFADKHDVNLSTPPLRFLSCPLYASFSLRLPLPYQPLPLPPFCLSVCLSVSVSVFLSHVTVTHHITYSLCVSVSVCLCLSVSASVSVCVLSLIHI